VAGQVNPLPNATVDHRPLFDRWREWNDHRAREELIELFMPLARKLARRYLGAGQPYDDLLQVASLALIKAVDRFDPDRGTAFTTFAVPTILGDPSATCATPAGQSGSRAALTT
jgi:RNA polymerase sigma-B factor